MTEPASLPALKPKKRDDPFVRNIAAILEGGAEADLQEQAPRPRGGRKGSFGKEKVAVGETSRVHTRVPTELMIELQVYCARNRTTMQDLVHTLIADFLAKRAK